MRFTIHKNAWWVRKGYGIVLWPFVGFGDDDPPEWLVKHELNHCRQIADTGVLKFYALYCWYLLRHGYRDNPFEKDARSDQDTPLTREERKWIDQRRITL